MEEGWLMHALVNTKVRHSPILVTVNLSVKESVKENVPVDSDSQIPNLLLLLTLRCEWCFLEVN